jgi:NADH-quinone oxidoreductase subunit F
LEPNLLLPTEPYTTLASYLEAGGGTALRATLERGPDWTIEQIDRAGVRGRGGAGFPAARKWESVRAGGPQLGDRYVVANGAEGEPGTFKDRPLMRSNPYAVIEGLSVAATVVGAREAFIAVKASFTPEITALERALDEMAAAGVLCEAPVSLIGGPEEYLFGEEKGLLEVIEGNDPMPRWLPPYLHGLFASTPQEGWSAGRGQTEAPGVTGSNPTLVTNVETLADVTLVLTRGADWFRSIGTEDTAGPLLCSVVGDVDHAGFGEIEPGRPLGDVIEEIAGGPRRSHSIKAVLSGVSNPVLGADALGAPVSHAGLGAAGGGLGSVGFIVYDESRSMLAVARMVSRFLYVESCGQCRACKFGCGEITRGVDRFAREGGTESGLAVLRERLRAVTDQNRCFLGEEEQRVVSSLLDRFPDDFLRPPDAPADEQLPIPKIIDILDGVATYDERAKRKRPDWTYAP